MRKLWDLNEFNKVNLPEVVGNLRSYVDMVDFSEPKGTRVLDMAVYMPDQDRGFRFTKEIKNFAPAIALIFAAEYKIDPKFLDTHYVYVTVDQKMVHKGETGRRAGAHSDASISLLKTKI